MYNSVCCDSCRAAELMFEKYKAPALFLAKNAVSEWSFIDLYFN